MCFKLMQDDVVQKARWIGQKIGILGMICRVEIRYAAVAFHIANIIFI